MNFEINRNLIPIELPKPEHVRHQGKRERERRLKQLEKEAQKEAK